MGLFSKKIKSFRINFYDNSYKRLRGAKVYLKKVEKGEELFKEGKFGSAVFYDLDNGEYRLRVEKEGYEPFDKGINLTDSGEYDAHLTPETIIGENRVEVRVEDDDGGGIDALIEIDGVSETGPIGIFKLKEGDYELKVSHEGCESVLKAIVVRGDLKETIVLKRKPGSLELFVRTPSGKPVSNARVLIRGQELLTDEKGSLTTTLPSREHPISIHKEMYVYKSEKLMIQPGKTTRLEVVLEPEIKMSREHSNRLEKALNIIYNARNEIGGGSYDQTLPEYFCDVCERIVTSVKQEAEDMEDFTSEEAFEKKIQDCVETVEAAIPAITQGMMERRNLVLYSSTSSLPKEEPSELQLSKSTDTANVKSRLVSIDNQITEKTKELTIYPAAALWGVARNLLNAPTEANSKVASIILDSTEHMFNDQVLKKRLGAST